MSQSELVFVIPTYRLRDVSETVATSDGGNRNFALIYTLGSHVVPRAAADAGGQPEKEVRPGA